MTKPPEAGAEPLSAEAFYSEVYTEGREDPPDTFKFAEAYAAHVSQGYERRIQELERGLSLYKRAHEHLMEVMGLEKDELQVPRAAEKWQEAERQLAEAREALRNIKRHIFSGRFSSPTEVMDVLQLVNKETDEALRKSGQKGI